MKGLAIRYWLAIALGIYFLSSVAPFVFVGTVVCSTERPAPDTSTLAAMLSADVARWSDPGWQSTVTAQLPTQTSLVLLNRAGQELFRTGQPPLDPTPAGYMQLVVMDGTQLLGVADLYDISPCAGTIYGTLALPASLLVQVVVGALIALVITRYMLRPLSSVRKAARQIAHGNLDFQILPSRVHEVADVAAAFEAMGDGLRASVTRQAQLEQDRRFFISAIAHDLRTPLFALRGYLEGLERGLATTPEKTAHYVQICQEKADALEHLIADLFAYSRLEYLEQTPHREPMDFAKLVNKAIDTVRPRAEASHIALLLDGPPSPCEVRADWALLERALGNLLDNALRYVPASGWIKITWRQENGNIRFVVADSGPGIPTQELSHLFTPLYRSETSRNRQTGGAGLGLTIARRIMQAHGGDLTAGNGTTGGAEFAGTFTVN